MAQQSKERNQAAVLKRLCTIDMTGNKKLARLSSRGLNLFNWCCRMIEQASKEAKVRDTLWDTITLEDADIMKKEAHDKGAPRGHHVKLYLEIWDSCKARFDKLPPPVQGIDTWKTDQDFIDLEKRARENILSGKGILVEKTILPSVVIKSGTVSDADQAVLDSWDVPENPLAILHDQQFDQVIDCAIGYAFGLFSGLPILNEAGLTGQYAPTLPKRVTFIATPDRVAA